MFNMEVALSLGDYVKRQQRHCQWNMRATLQDRVGPVKEAREPLTWLEQPRK
jgi:hypothetical protein